MKFLPLVLAATFLFAACTTTAPIVPPTPTPASEAPAPTTIPSTTSTTAAPADPVAAELASLIAVTEGLRLLEFKIQPTIELLDAGAFARRVKDHLDEALSQQSIEVDEQLYQLLGILEPNESLASLYADVAGEQTAAFYDTDSQSLVVPEPDGAFTVIERVTIVHELVHALTDQHFGTTAQRDSLSGGSYDKELALAGLVEGDATYVEGLYIETLGPEALAELVAAYGTIDSDSFNEAPPFIQETLLAPYIDGLEFVLSLIGSGGLDALDAAYLAPPSTTEQVRHPEAYLSGDVGRTFEMDIINVDGYEAVETSVWGESALIGLLSEQLLSDVVFAGAEGWNGDGFEVLSNGTDVAFRLIFFGDTAEDDQEFLDAITTFMELAIDPEAFAEARHAGSSIVVVISSQLGVGPLIFDQMDF